MGHDQDALAGLEAGQDGVLPVRQHTDPNVFEALGAWQVGGGQLTVARVVAGKTTVPGVKRRRADVKMLLPQRDLPRAVALGRIDRG